MISDISYSYYLNTSHFEKSLKAITFSKLKRTIQLI